MPKKGHQGREVEPMETHRWCHPSDVAHWLAHRFFVQAQPLILSGWLSGDPCARGLPLRYWLDVLHYCENGNPRPDRRTKAAEALIAIGADAGPALTEILLTPDPPNVHSLLFEEKPFVPRKEAAWCLFRLGEPGRASFLDALRGLDHLPHVAAVRVLAAVRPRPIEQLLEGALAHSKADKEHPLELRKSWARCMERVAHC